MAAMRMGAAAVVSILLLASCGDGDDGPATCGPRGGQYKLTMRSETSTCPKVVEQVVEANRISPCFDDPYEAPSDACESQVKVSCSAMDPNPIGGGYFISSRSAEGVIRWASGGAMGSGTVSVSILVTSTRTVTACSGVYDVTYTRL